MTYILQYTNY